MEIIRGYYVQIFTKDPDGDDTSALDALECKVTAEMNEALTKTYKIEEVLKAIKQMHPAKAPGPDGMTPLFFQKFWSICKSDVLGEVLGILNHGRSPRSIIARILAKTIANRLKSMLPDIISTSQSAFIPGRLITDNAMTAFEVFHTMKKRKKGKRGWMAMKLDMSKAYNRVDWAFLERVMSGLTWLWAAFVLFHMLS